MANTTLNSLDNILTQSANNGAWPILFTNYPGSPTTATTSSGYVTMCRCTSPIVMPSSFGTGVTGAYLTYCRIIGVTNTMVICGIEYLLGTLTVSGNSYSAGVSMPTKTVKGVSTQTAASYAFAVVTTNLTATAPVLTVNYTNQAGTTGRSCTLTLPNSPVSSTAFFLNANLQSGDSGIRTLSATGMSISTGSAGVIKLYGVLPLSSSSGAVGASCFTPDPLTVSEVPYKIEASENINFYRSSGNTLLIAALNFVPSD